MSSGNATFKYVKKLIFSSKHDPNSTNPADFTINFANSDFSHGHISGMLMVDMVIPNMFYNVNEGNRRVVISDDTNVVTYTIDMPIGQYTAEQYFDEFSLQLTSASGGAFNVTLAGVHPNTGILNVFFDQSETWELDQMTDAAKDLLGLGVIVTPIFDINGFLCPANFGGVKSILVKTDLMAANTTLGSENKQEAIVDFISLADTCYGTCKHHRVYDQGIRHHDFPRNTSLQEVHFTLTDVHGVPLVLPCNTEVITHLTIVMRND